MRLLGSLTSPYVRKARIVLAEKRIEYTFDLDNPWDEKSRVPDANPLGKVPVLVLEDDSTLFDSRVIVEFLDSVSPISRLIPSNNREKIEVKRWEALADGVLDAAVAVVLERRRPVKQKSETTIQRQMDKIERGVAVMARDLGAKPWCTGNAFTLADIACGVALGYLDFRHDSYDWRVLHTNLAKLAAKLARASVLRRYRTARNAGPRRDRAQVERIGCARPARYWTSAGACITESRRRRGRSRPGTAPPTAPARPPTAAARSRVQGNRPRRERYGSGRRPADNASWPHRPASRPARCR